MVSTVLNKKTKKKRDKEWFSSTGGTVSEGGKQQMYKNFCVSGQNEGWLQEESLH